MYRKLLFSLCLVLLSAVMAMAQDDPKSNQPAAPSGPKELSGMSIVGNDEAPKSLYIVPWKSSELGTEAGLSMMVSDGEVPVDREVFMRQLDFYEVCTRNMTTVP
jgi:hypothetical protein